MVSTPPMVIRFRELLPTMSFTPGTDQLFSSESKRREKRTKRRHSSSSSSDRSRSRSPRSNSERDAVRKQHSLVADLNKASVVTPTNVIDKTIDLSSKMDETIPKSLSFAELMDIIRGQENIYKTRSRVLLIVYYFICKKWPNLQNYFAYDRIIAALLDLIFSENSSEKLERIQKLFERPSTKAAQIDVDTMWKFLTGHIEDNDTVNSGKDEEEFKKLMEENNIKYNHRYLQILFAEFRDFFGPYLPKTKIGASTVRLTNSGEDGKPQISIGFSSPIPVILIIKEISSGVYGVQIRDGDAPQNINIAEMIKKACIEAAHSHGFNTLNGISVDSIIYVSVCSHKGTPAIDCTEDKNRCNYMVTSNIKSSMTCLGFCSTAHIIKSNKDKL